MTTPYFLQLDDDMEFTKETHIERLAEVVHSHGVDICGGDVIWSRRSFLRTRRKSAPYHGLLELDGERLIMRRGYSERREGYALCDIVVQFFVARTASVLEIGGWDADLKTEEHEEFFVRAKRHGLTTAHCPEVKAVHWNSRPAHYVPYRARDYRPLAAQKMGVTEWTGMDGQRVV